jgi:hypothetical protein
MREVTLPNILLDAASIAGVLIPLIFMLSYVGYGNRFRAPVGRALMVLGLGSMGLMSIFFVHHPLGISTADSTWAAWYQIVVSAVFCAAMGWVTSIMVRANGRWPWQRS